MSQPANLRGWGPGWPVNRIKDMVWVQAARSGAKWLVHREIAPIVQFLIDEVERRGYLFDHGPADVDDDWGYVNRPIGGTRRPSNHSWGLAIDFDAQQYPQHSNKRAPQWIYDLFYAYGFEIGADWAIASRDPMHVEFRGSVSEARFLVAMLAASHLAQQAPVIPATTPPPAYVQQSEEDDMPTQIIRRQTDGLVEVISDFDRRQLTPDQYQIALFAGRLVRDVDARGFDQLTAGLRRVG